MRMHSIMSGLVINGISTNVPDVRKRENVFSSLLAGIAESVASVSFPPSLTTLKLTRRSDCGISSDSLNYKV